MTKCDNCGIEMEKPTGTTMFTKKKLCSKCWEEFINLPGNKGRCGLCGQPRYICCC